MGACAGGGVAGDATGALTISVGRGVRTDESFPALLLAYPAHPALSNSPGGSTFTTTVETSQPSLSMVRRDVPYANSTSTDHSYTAEQCQSMHVKWGRSSATGYVRHRAYRPRTLLTSLRRPSATAPYSFLIYTSYVLSFPQKFIPQLLQEYTNSPSSLTLATAFPTTLRSRFLQGRRSVFLPSISSTRLSQNTTNPPP